MAWLGSASWAAMVLGRAAPVADLVAAQRRESARVGALEQLVPGLLVEAAQAPLVPLAVVMERDAPDEVLPVVVARLLPASASTFLLASSSSWSTTLSSSEDSRRGSRVASRWVGELMVRLETIEKELADSIL